MPLPYTHLYKNLTNKLKTQFNNIPFYYTHIHNTNIHIKYLLNNIYNITIISQLTTKNYLTQKNLYLTLKLKPHTYINKHQLIYHKNKSTNVKHVKLNNHSTNQKIITNIFFNNNNIKQINLSYHKNLQHIIKNNINTII